MCPWQWMDGQGPSGQCSPGQEWWIQLHQWIAVINRMPWRWLVTATHQRQAPGVVSRERAGSGMQVNQVPANVIYRNVKLNALQSRWRALLRKGSLLVLWYTHRLGFISAPGCCWAPVVRTSTRRLDKSWLYIVFLGSPKWNVLHPCLLQCIDTERY